MDDFVLESIVRILHRKNLNVRYYVNRKYGCYEETLLHCWIRLNNKNKSTRKLLLEYGADINATEMYGKSLLHTAVSCGNYETTKWLLDKGAYVNSQNIFKETPLHYAANGNIDLGTLLLTQGADPNCINKKGETPLSLAAKFTHTEVVKLLLTYGGDTARIDFSGMAEMDFSQHIRHFCEQNISYSAGNTFIRRNGHNTSTVKSIYFSYCTKT